MRRACPCMQIMVISEVHFLPCLGWKYGKNPLLSGRQHNVSRLLSPMAWCHLGKLLLFDARITRNT